MGGEIEAERIAALKRLSILDTPSDSRFDHLTELAAFIFKVPIVLISLVDEDRQWFKSTVGITLEETERDIAFCDYAIRSDDVMIVPNALRDERFKNNPLVVGEPGIRFYAGAPLKTPDGHRIGTLCVLDVRPRATPTELMQGRLKALAASVMDAMLVRGALGEPRPEASPAIAPKSGQQSVAEENLKRMQWAFNAYGRAASALLHSETFDDVAKCVCEALVEDDIYCTAFVGLADRSPQKAVKVVARSGRASGYVDGLNLSWADDDWTGQGPTGRAIRSGLPELLVDTHESLVFTPWRARADIFGIRSSVTIPFSRDEGILGVLVVYGSQPNAFGPQEMEIFQKLGEELAFAMTLERDRRDFAEAKTSALDAKEAVSQFAKRDEFYQMLFEQIEDIVVSYDLDGRIDYASPSIRQLAYTPSEVVGKNLAAFLPLEYGKGFSLNALERGEPLPYGRSNLFQLYRRDGSLIWVEGRPTKLHSETGEVSGIVTVLRDVTERVATEEALRQKRVEAEAASAAKAQFLANMSHELRTPLTGVLGFADFLDQMVGLPDPAPRYIDRIVTGGRNLLALVNDILDFSRLDAGGLEADPQPLEVRGLVDEVVEALRLKAAAKGLVLGASYAGDVPDWISTDAQRVRQILTNLVGNALKFTTSGSVQIRVEPCEPKSQTLRFAVTDTGHGIPQDQIERIFQRFAQVDESNTRQFGGAGLGLSISKGLVEMLGGEIGVESEVGSGSTFWFTIFAPVVVEPQRDAVVEEAAEELSPLRILLVEDVEQNRELVRIILSPFGVELAEAADGQEAVEVANESRFDVILMDVQMPRLDGRAATRAIRAGSLHNKTTPILALSADVLPQHIEACEAAGMNDHIAKPINVQNLLNKIALWTTGP